MVGTDPMTGIGTSTEVGMGLIFTEGPVWRPTDGVLLFSDIQANTIYELTPPDTVVPWRNPSGNANGLIEDTEGLLLAAEHGTHRVSRTLANGDVVTVVEDFEGDELNSPNDLVVRSDGTIYFTDPPYGRAGNTVGPVGMVSVYRVDPQGALSVEFTTASNDDRPNGIVLSPDESTLYFDDTALGNITAMDVATDGSLSNPRDFVAAGLGGADGMAVDCAGNLYVTYSGGVEVIDANGTSWGTITVPRQPANVTFGGPNRDTLYVTARESVYAYSATIPGQ